MCDYCMKMPALWKSLTKINLFNVRTCNVQMNVFVKILQLN